MDTPLRNRLPVLAPRPPRPDKILQQNNRITLIPHEKILEYSRAFDDHEPRLSNLSKNQLLKILFNTDAPVDMAQKIMNLSDTHGTRKFNITEFIIAIHVTDLIKRRVLAELPANLPDGFYAATKYALYALRDEGSASS